MRSNMSIGTSRTRVLCNGSCVIALAFMRVCVIYRGCAGCEELSDDVKTIFARRGCHLLEILSSK